MKDHILTEENWERVRLGRITSSGIGKLLQSGTKGNYFGKGALSYIDDLIAQRLVGQSNDISELRAIEWGLDYEAEAYAKCMEVWQPDDCDFYGNNQRLFLTLGDFIGGSPDFIATKDGKTYIGEIKCPYSSVNHVKALLLNSGVDLLEYNKTYYAQLQFNMLLYASVSGANLEDIKGLFVSYDPRIKADNVNHLTLSIIEVGLDADFINEAKERAEKAVEVMKEKVRKIYNKQNYGTSK